VVERDADVVEVMDLAWTRVHRPGGAPRRDAGEPQEAQDRGGHEYERSPETYLTKEGYDFTILKSFGTTEVFPPDDADAIVDNTSSGTTLRENGLDIIAVIMTSSTRLIASKAAMANPAKAERLNEMVSVSSPSWRQSRASCWR
jgi:ATP phosphoribosyltransferase